MNTAIQEILKKISPSSWDTDIERVEDFLLIKNRDSEKMRLVEQVYFTRTEKGLVDKSEPRLWLFKEGEQSTKEMTLKFENIFAFINVIEKETLLVEGTRHQILEWLINKEATMNRDLLEEIVDEFQEEWASHIPNLWTYEKVNNDWYVYDESRAFIGALVETMTDEIEVL